MSVFCAFFSIQTRVLSVFLCVLCVLCVRSVSESVYCVFCDFQGRTEGISNGESARKETTQQFMILMGTDQFISEKETSKETTRDGRDAASLDFRLLICDGGRDGVRARFNGLGKSVAWPPFDSVFDADLCLHARDHGIGGWTQDVPSLKSF